LEEHVTATGVPHSSDGRDRLAVAPAHTGEINTLVDIYGKHERRIYRYCLALLRNPDDAEDATQETFTRAAPFLPNLAGDLSAYLTTVARNICCDVVRARAKRPVPLDDVVLPDRSVSPERQSIDWDVVRRMWRQLSPSERLLFAYTFAGYRYEEIASRTGMSRPSVSVGLTRARRRLRDLATAIGALGALPLGLRRLLDRGARRANAAIASGQQLLASVAEQAASIAAGLLAGMVTLGAAGTASVAMPPALAAADHEPGGAGSAGPATPVGRSSQMSRGLATRHVPVPTPAPSPTPTPAPLVTQAATLLPGGNATPDDIQPDSVTPSPGFTGDGIAFFTASDVAACPGGAGCPTLYRTGDGGATWTRVWSSTYRGGTVLLPPGFPADPTVFVLDLNAGLESGTMADPGPSPAVPGAVAAAIAPDSPAGHAHIAAATQAGTLLSYTAGDTAPSTGASLPAGVTPTGMVFTGPGQVLVAGFQVSGLPLPSQQAVLVQCAVATSCGAPLVVAGETALSLAPGSGEGGPVVAYSMQHAYLSTDGGASVRRIASAAGDRLLEALAVGSGPSGPRILLSDTDLATQRRIGVSYSDDLGASFTDATGNLAGVSGALLARVLPGGAMLVGLLTQRAHFAMDLSSGNGTWTAAHPS
jgi:RNA polymerase sigma factor (sigma-70 family)